MKKGMDAGTAAPAKTGCRNGAKQKPALSAGVAPNAAIHTLSNAPT